MYTPEVPNGTRSDSVTTVTSAAILVPDNRRPAFLPKVFGRKFVLCEATVFSLMSQLSPDYSGGFWDFLELSGGGAYMRPTGRDQFLIRSENGYEGCVSADAAGIIVCLYAFSHLSFDPSLDTDRLSDGYHALREFAMDHAEAGSIMAATD